MTSIIMPSLNINKSNIKNNNIANHFNYLEHNEYLTPLFYKYN